MEHLGKQEKLRMIRAGAAGLINALWALGVQNLATPSPRHLAVTKGCPGERESRFLPTPRLLLSEPSCEGGQRNPNSTLDPGLCPLSFSSPCHYL